MEQVVVRGVVSLRGESTIAIIVLTDQAPFATKIFYTLANASISH
jgi:DNA topoisomerase VI subunit A